MGPPSRSELAKCFIGSNIVALGAGTPYMYSFYAPQLLLKCNLPISKLSTLSLAMSLGSSLLGFFAGMVIDRNVTASCLIGAISTFSAYSILHYCYVNEVANVLLISFGLLLVGFGSVFGFYSAVKCCTTNFPHHRGTAGSFPVSLYALSGMLFSSICTKAFGDDIEKIFTFLTYTCSSMIFVGVLTIKIMNTPKVSKLKKRNSSALQQRPKIEGSGAHGSEVGAAQPIAISEVGYEDNFAPRLNHNHKNSHSSSSSTSLASSFQSIWSNKRSDSFLWSKDLTGSLSFWGWGKVRDENTQLEETDATGPYISQQSAAPSRTRQSYSSIHSNSQNQRLAANSKIDHRDSFKRDHPGTGMLPNNHNNDELVNNMVTDRAISLDKSSWKDSHLFQTIKRPRFMVYFIILATLQGIGQMYIYSVGFIVQTQVYSTPTEEYKLNPEAIQSLQVSMISILSFLGRLSSGPISDLLIKKLKAQRLWNIVVAGLIFVFASFQMLKDNSSNSVSTSEVPDNINNISYCSALFGYAFGVLFGTFPSIIADAFGTNGFSTIWGLSTSGGLLTVKIFCSVLGTDLQKNTKEGEKFCANGSQCYRHTFQSTAIYACIITIVTLCVIGITYWKKHVLGTKADLHRVEYILSENDDEIQDSQSAV